MSFQRTFCVKLRQWVCMSANGRVWLEITNQLNNCYKGDCYLMIIYHSSTQNSVWSHFILNGLMGGKLFFILFSGGWFTEVATYLGLFSFNFPALSMSWPGMRLSTRSLTILYLDSMTSDFEKKKLKLRPGL